MEAVGRLRGLEHGDVLRERRVEGVGNAVGRRPAFHAHARDLAGGVDTRIRAPRDREAVPAREDGVKCLAQHPLDRAQRGLPRPAVEAGSVVFERQSQIHDVTSWRWPPLPVEWEA